MSILIPLGMIGWLVLIIFNVWWRIGHHRRMREMQRQLDEINRVKP